MNTCIYPLHLGSSRLFTLINNLKQLYTNSTTNTPIRNGSNISDVVYKYDTDTDIFTKYLTKSLLSILLQLFLSLFSFFLCNFFFEKLNTKYKWFLISTHLKVLLRMPLFWLTHWLIDYNLKQDELLKLFEYWCFFYKCKSIHKHFSMTLFFENNDS